MPMRRQAMNEEAAVAAMTERLKLVCVCKACQLHVSGVTVVH
jgi:hypothetical protein